MHLIESAEDMLKLTIGDLVLQLASAQAEMAKREKVIAELTAQLEVAQTEGANT